MDLVNPSAVHPKAPWIVGKTRINQWISVPFFLVKAQMQDQSHLFQDLTIEHFTGFKPEKHACSWVVHLPIIPAEDERTHLIGFPRSCAVKIHYWLVKTQWNCWFMSPFYPHRDQGPWGQNRLVLDLRYPQLITRKCTQYCISPVNSLVVLIIWTTNWLLGCHIGMKIIKFIKSPHLISLIEPK